MTTYPKDHLVNEHGCIPQLPADTCQKVVSAGVESLQKRANYLGNRAENVGKLEFFIPRLFFVQLIQDDIDVSCFSYSTTQ